MSISGKTKVFGLFGNPIEHTISPFIHELLYEASDYDGVYNPFYVPINGLENAVKGIHGLSIEGVNVTVPYKVEVMKYLDNIDPMAKNIGAVNTLVREEGGLTGYNTDWIGLKMACTYEGFEIKDKDVVIVGAGGSARAIAFMCYQAEAKSVLILNRTLSKAKTICDNVQALYKESIKNSSKDNSIFTIDYGNLNDISKVKQGSLAFQTTSLGLHPDIESSPIEDRDFFNKVDFIVDIIYNPKETSFIKYGHNHGARTMNGLKMLFFQAVKAFELWTDIVFTDEQLNTMLKKLEDYMYNK